MWRMGAQRGQFGAYLQLAIPSSKLGNSRGEAGGPPSGRARPHGKAHFYSGGGARATRARVAAFDASCDLEGSSTGGLLHSKRLGAMCGQGNSSRGERSMPATKMQGVKCCRPCKQGAWLHCRRAVLLSIVCVCVPMPLGRRGMRETLGRAQNAKMQVSTVMELRASGGLCWCCWRKPPPGVGAKALLVNLRRRDGRQQPPKHTLLHELRPRRCRRRRWAYFHARRRRPPADSISIACRCLLSPLALIEFEMKGSNFRQGSCSGD